MNCWICQRRGTSTDTLGTCIKCHVFACDGHSDRQTKGEFWCFVCLQRLALNAAGIPAPVGAEVDTDDMLTSTETEQLAERLGVGDGGGQLDNVDPVVVDILATYQLTADDMTRLAIRLAVALAQATSPSRNLIEGRGGQPDSVDPRLVGFVYGELR